MQKTEGSREQSTLAFIRQFLGISVGWEPWAGWIHHTKHLQRQTPIFCESLKYEVKAVEPSMWRANQGQAASVATDEQMPFFSLIHCDQFSLSCLQF